MKKNGPFGATGMYDGMPGKSARRIGTTYIAATKTADGREFVGTGKTYPEAIKAAQRARKAVNSHNLTGKGEL